MRHTIDLHERIRAPYWRTCALLELEADDLVRPAMDELRVGVGGTELARRVRSEVGPLVCEADRARLQLRWHAEEHPEWFPELDAELEFTPAADDATDLHLVGGYEPPLGPVGAIGDRLVGHRLAEQSLREFLTGVARRLTDEIIHHHGR
ncbi:MAG TPA: hypothetical protein VF152_00850 [Acidimicrobiia bacterium]